MSEDELRRVLRKAVMDAMHDNPSSYLEHGDTADHIVSVVMVALDAYAADQLDAEELHPTAEWNVGGLS